MRRVFLVLLIASRMTRMYLVRHRILHHTYAEIQKPVPARSVRRSVMILSAYVSLLYLFWRILFTLPSGRGLLTSVCAVLLLSCEAMDIADSLLNNRIISQRGSYPLPDTDPDAVWPDVDVFIATYNESRQLLYKTVRGCLNMACRTRSGFTFICVMMDSARKSGIWLKNSMWDISPGLTGLVRKQET